MIGTTSPSRSVAMTSVVDDAASNKGAFTETMTAVGRASPAVSGSAARQAARVNVAQAAGAAQSTSRNCLAIAWHESESNRSASEARPRCQRRLVRARAWRGSGVSSAGSRLAASGAARSPRRVARPKARSRGRAGVPTAPGPARRGPPRPAPNSSRETRFHGRLQPARDRSLRRHRVALEDEAVRLAKTGVRSSRCGQHQRAEEGEAHAHRRTTSAARFASSRILSP